MRWSVTQLFVLGINIWLFLGVHEMNLPFKLSSRNTGQGKG